MAATSSPSLTSLEVKSEGEEEKVERGTVRISYS
jgi:hypothetical protein